MKNSISYCHVTAKDPEYDDEAYPSPLVDNDLFEYEMSSCGLYHDDHIEFFNNLKTGYYKIEYTVGKDSETCDGYTLYEWDEIEEYLSATPAPFYGRWLYYSKRAQYKWGSFLNHFLPVWSIDWDYGGAGITSSNLYLPQVLFYKVWNCKNFPKWGYVPSWGPGFTSTRIRKYW